MRRKYNNRISTYTHARYKLKILPFGRSGSFEPFTHQVMNDSGFDNDSGIFDGGKSKVSLDGVSLCHIRSQSMGKLVTLKGMIV